MKTAVVTGACTNTGVDIVNKFLSEGVRVVFTGRSPEKVAAALQRYRKNYPGADVLGYALNSVTEDAAVDEKGVDDFFSFLDNEKITADILVLNAADQGLGMKIFENPLSDFINVINTNMIWNYLIVELSAKRMINEGGGNIIFINSIFVPCASNFNKTSSIWNKT